MRATKIIQQDLCIRLVKSFFVTRGYEILTFKNSEFNTPSFLALRFKLTLTINVNRIC